MFSKRHRKRTLSVYWSLACGSAAAEWLPGNPHVVMNVECGTKASCGMKAAGDGKPQEMESSRRWKAAFTYNMKKCCAVMDLMVVWQ